MAFLTNIQQFLSDLRAQKLRSSLTILGITWGTVSVVVLLAFGVGLQQQSRRNMHGMGEGIAVLFPNKTTKPYMGFPDGRRVQFTEHDIDIIKAQIPEIRQISAEFRESNTPVHVGINRTTPTIVGANSQYGDMRNIIPAMGGRYINPIDVRDRRRVVVLGDKVKNLLFGDKTAVGKQVYIGQSPFTVIGVMIPKVQNSSYGDRDENCLFIPISTYNTIFGQKYLNDIILKIDKPTQAAQIKEQLRTTLGQIHKFDPTDQDAFFIWDTNEMDKFLTNFFLGFNIFMGIVGSFTLTVGGIGVANIMFIVVKEKTREIGIKRSIGATRRNIMFQFFLESISIVLIGAFLGFLISLGITAIAQILPIKEYVGTPSISGMVIFATVILLSLIAFLAGYFPARRASQLEPVECLRY